MQGQQPRLQHSDAFGLSGGLGKRGVVGSGGVMGFSSAITFTPLWCHARRRGQRHRKMKGAIGSTFTFSDYATYADGPVRIWAMTVR